MIDLPILFEDNALVAIDKPAGIVVNNAESVKEKTVQDWSENRYHFLASKPVDSSPKTNSPGAYDTEADFYNRAGIVHRIDKETSGMLLIAKTLPAFIELQRQFKERLIKKTYLAIVHGKLVPESGEIRAPVGRLPWNKERFGIVPGGKDSMTRYNVQNGQLIVEHEPFSLVELYPETGRTHQIRVHLKYINHPILGDYLYAGRKTSRDDREWAPRVMLHAWKISFTHPATAQPLALVAPMPDDMKRIVENKGISE